jgi:hypothetical protein
MGKHLTEAQIRQFREQGWVAPMRVMSEQEAATCCERIAAMEAATGKNANAFLKIKGHLAAPWLVDLARRPAILDAVEDVIGPDILLFGASIFAKGARDRSYVSWHQDSAYFGLTPHEEVTVWVAFTQSNAQNGCLRVLPGSHIGENHRHIETFAPDNMLARGQTIEGIADSAGVDVELQAGEFSMHHECTAHGSLTNRSDARRIGFAFFYIPAHVDSKLGRRTALLMRGQDRTGKWDSDPLPQSELDPVAFAALRAAWGQYRDGAVKQAAEVE